MIMANILYHYIYIILILINGYYSLPAVESVVRSSLTMSIFCFYFLTAVLFLTFRLFAQKYEAKRSDFFHSHGNFSAVITIVVWLVTLIGIITEVSFFNFLCLSFCLSTFYPDEVIKKTGFFITLLMCSPTLIFSVYSHWYIHSIIAILIVVLMFGDFVGRLVKVSQVNQ